MKKIKTGSLYRQTRQNTEKSVPFIRLSGEWLKKIGFYEGNTVSIEFEHGKLILRADPKI